MVVDFIPLLLYILLGLLTVLLGLFLSFLLYLHYIHKINEHLPGPPRPSFVFGHLLELRAHRKAGGTLVDYLSNYRAEYGSIYVLFFIQRPLVVVSDPACLKEAMIGQHHCAVIKSKSSMQKIGYLFGQRFLGTSILTDVDEESWRKRRHLMNPAFHRKRLKDFVVDFNEVCDRFLARIAAIAEEKQEASMVKEFGRAALDVISQVSFNVNIGAIEDPDTPFARATVLALQGVQASLNTPIHPILQSIFQFRLFQSDSQRKQISAAKFVREFARECITNRINDIKANKDVPNDLLSLLVNDKSLSKDDIADEFVTIFFAGHETTSNSLAFALYEIAQNPDIEEKILHELDEVLGDKENVDFEDLAKLKYLGQVLQESLRKYPVAGGPTRKVAKEITLGGYKIPKGNAITFTKHLFNHNPENWKNPDVFDPERFAEPEKIPNFNYLYFPFSLGPRNCIGQAFAKFESKVLLARLLHKFRFQLLPGQTGAMVERLTMTPRDGVMCKVMLR